MAQETKYNTTQIFPLGGGRFADDAPDVPLRVITNGGSVTLGVLADGDRVGGEFVDEAAISTDGTYSVIVKRNTIRITVAGGAEYSFPVT